MDPKGPKMAVLYRSPEFGKDCFFITNYEDLKKKKIKNLLAFTFLPRQRREAVYYEWKWSQISFSLQNIQYPKK